MNVNNNTGNLGNLGDSMQKVGSAFRLWVVLDHANPKHLFLEMRWCNLSSHSLKPLGQSSCHKIKLAVIWMNCFLPVELGSACLYKD